MALTQKMTSNRLPQNGRSLARADEPRRPEEFALASTCRSTHPRQNRSGYAPQPFHPAPGAAPDLEHTRVSVSAARFPPVHVRYHPAGCRRIGSYRSLPVLIIVEPWTVHPYNFHLSSIMDGWTKRLARRYDLLVCLFAAAIYLIACISPPALMDDVDAVQAQIARNMLDSGDWVTARLNGIAYLEKSPLVYWMMAACRSPSSAFTIGPLVCRLRSA